MHCIKKTCLLISILVSMTSCSKSSGETFTVSLYIDNPSTNAFIQEVCDSYNLTHNNKINLKIDNYGESGQSIDYDISFVDGETAKGLYENDKIEKIDSVFAQKIIDNSEQYCASLFCNNNDLFAFPISIKVDEFLYYDGTLLKDDEVESFETIIDVLSKINQKCCINLFTPIQYFGLFAGGNAFTDIKFFGDKITSVSDSLNSEEGLKVSKSLSLLLSNDKIDVNKTSPILSKGYAVVVSGSWAEDHLKSYYGNNLRKAFLPSYNSIPWRNSIQSKGLVVSKTHNPDKRKVIFEFAEELTNKNNQSKLSSLFGNNYHSISLGASNSISNDLKTLQRVKDGYDYNRYPMKWVNIADVLIDKIISDHGELNETALLNSLSKYHDDIVCL